MVYSFYALRQGGIPMTNRRRTLSNCLIAGMCTLCMIAPGRFAASQQAESQEEQNAQSKQQLLSTSTSPDAAKPLRPGELSAYMYLADDIGAEDETTKARAQEGKDLPRKRNYSKLLHISERDEQTMRRILLDAFDGIKASDAEELRLTQEMGSDPSRRPELRAKLDALSKEPRNILIRALAALRQELSEDGFKRVDSYAYNGVLLPPPETPRQIDRTPAENPQ
jgi:hypothetical protein